MKRILKKSAVFFAALLLCICLLAGCAKEGQTSSTATPAPTGAEQSSQATPVGQDDYMGNGIFRVEGEEDEFSYLTPGTTVRLYHWWYNGPKGRTRPF